MGACSYKKSEEKVNRYNKIPLISNTTNGDK